MKCRHRIVLHPTKYLFPRLSRVLIYKSVAVLGAPEPVLAIHVFSNLRHPSVRFVTGRINNKVTGMVKHNGTFQEYPFVASIKRPPGFRKPLAPFGGARHLTAIKPEAD